MERYRTIIHIDGNSIDDVFRLPCVFSCHKEPDGTLCYLLYDWDSNGNYIQARTGDLLCEDYEGRWTVEHKKD